jgi:hypothetical protein
MQRIFISLGVLLWIAAIAADGQEPQRRDHSGSPSAGSRSPSNNNNGMNHRFGLFPGPYILGPDYWYYAQPVFITVPTPYPYPLLVPPYLSYPPVRQAPPAPPQNNQPPAVNPPAANNPPPKQAPLALPPDDFKPKADMQRLVRIGNDYFADGKYAQALSQYERAVSAAPLEPLAYFHEAQADLALAKYGQAVIAIQRGLRLHPHWHTADFQPRALYRDRDGEFQQHLANLAEVTGKNPNDESLLFLLGYELWFDGKRDEAVVLLRKAATLAVDPTVINRFLEVAKTPVQ